VNKGILTTSQTVPISNTKMISAQSGSSASGSVLLSGGRVTVSDMLSQRSQGSVQLVAELGRQPTLDDCVLRHNSTVAARQWTPLNKGKQAEVCLLV
jgi:hypothetical protein